MIKRLHLRRRRYNNDWLMKKCCVRKCANSAKILQSVGKRKKRRDSGHKEKKKAEWGDFQEACQVEWEECQVEWAEELVAWMDFKVCLCSYSCLIRSSRQA
mmetsp:Transcript_104442/g.294398  ORF Transcript_104442/g.294398 Transcript_104442/m.294398 type:complete len:101 (+) Transcript_104442:443-745(+)